NRQFLRVDAAAEGGNVKFPSLLAHLRSGNLLPLQKILQVGLARCCHFTAHGRTGAVCTSVCIDRHNLPPQSVTLTREPSSFGWPAKLLSLPCGRFAAHSWSRYSAIDHVLQFIRVRRTRKRDVQRNRLGEIRAGESL